MNTPKPTQPRHTVQARSLPLGSVISHLGYRIVVDRVKELNPTTTQVEGHVHGTSMSVTQSMPSTTQFVV